MKVKEVVIKGISVKIIKVDGIWCYKHHYCLCGCGERILYPTNKEGLRNHKRFGIPKYIHGHHMKDKILGYGSKNGFKKGHIVSKETRQKMSESHKGEKNYNYGKATEYSFKSGEDNPEYIDGYGIERNRAIFSSLVRGFPEPVFLNKPFKHASFHHITKELGLFIPRKLHKSIWHSVKTGKNIEEMNDLAFDYVFKHM